MLGDRRQSTSCALSPVLFTFKGCDQRLCLAVLGVRWSLKLCWDLWSLRCNSSDYQEDQPNESNHAGDDDAVLLLVHKPKVVNTSAAHSLPQDFPDRDFNRCVECCKEVERSDWSESAQQSSKSLKRGKSLPWREWQVLSMVHPTLEELPTVPALYRFVLNLFCAERALRHLACYPLVVTDTIFHLMCDLLSSLADFSLHRSVPITSGRIRWAVPATSWNDGEGQRELECAITK
jgi:hypothetical protein